MREPKVQVILLTSEARAEELVTCVWRKLLLQVFFSHCSGGFPLSVISNGDPVELGRVAVIFCKGYVLSSSVLVVTI